MKLARLALLSLVATPAAAQETRYADDPTAGLTLPAAPLAGDHDAISTVVNPAGLPFLGGVHLELAATAHQVDGVTAGGSGFGLYLASPVALPILPRLGFGLAIEKLYPPRDSLAPDPGQPLRITLAGAFSVSGWLSAGLSWRSFHGEGLGNLDGVSTLDLGISARLGAELAVGLVGRDLLPPLVAGAPLERRYEGEIVFRPLSTDRLELAAAAAIGERRGTLDPRARIGVKLVPGLVLRAAGELRTHEEIDAENRTTRRSELLGSLGLEVSFGELGVAVYGTVSSGIGDTRVAGATVVARWSGERLPALARAGNRVERIKIGGGLDERKLTRILLTMRRHERDDGVRAVFLQLDGVAGGWADLQELREAIARLRARGKKVIAFMVAATTRDYYVACAADKIFLDAGGGIRLLGLSSSGFYLREFFDKLGVLPQFEKIEEYKSAPEMFTQSGPSPEAAEQRSALLEDIHHQVVQGIAVGRKLSEAAVIKLFDEGPYTAAEAFKLKIVDALVEPTDLDQLLLSELGPDVQLGEGLLPERPASWRLPQVAVVYLDGDIVDGKSQEVPLLGQKVSGGETLATALAWARREPRVRAVILRVSSPGGSALASEHIARAGFRLRGAKPFVVSIGDIAASGGYFAAAPGDIILAEPSSITGSIGIFTGKFDLSALLARVGISWEVVTRGVHADMESYLRPYTDEERATIKEKLRYYYMRFVSAVARGRGLSEEAVDLVGHGHVWTGSQARERKLIDRYGGLVDAIAEAKSRAGIDDDDPVEIVMLPREPESLLGRLMRFADGAQAASASPAPWDALLRHLPASLILEPEVPQARLPMVLVDE